MAMSFCVSASCQTQSGLLSNDILKLEGVLPVVNGQVGVPVQSDLRVLNLKGTVKQLQVGAVTYTFNRNGFIIQEDCVIKPSDRKEDLDRGRAERKGYKRTTTYDEYGRPLVVVEHDENNYFNYEIRYVYTNNGRIVKETHLDAKGGVVLTKERKYNMYGNLQEAVSYDRGGELVERCVCKVASDKSNRVFTFYNKEGAVIGIATHYYDLYSGVMKEKVARRFVGSEVELSRRAFVYNAIGRVIKEQSINEVGEVTEEVVYRYNSKDGIKIKRIIDKSNPDYILVEHEFRFNDNGDMIRSKDFGCELELDEWNTVKGTHPIDGSLVTQYEYQYDSHNNWIRREATVGSKKNKKTSVFTRTILYY